MFLNVSNRKERGSNMSKKYIERGFIPEEELTNASGGAEKSLSGILLEQPKLDEDGDPVPTALQNILAKSNNYDLVSSTVANITSAVATTAIQVAFIKKNPDVNPMMMQQLTSLMGGTFGAVSGAAHRQK